MNDTQRFVYWASVERHACIDIEVKKWTTDEKIAEIAGLVVRAQLPYRAVGRRGKERISQVIDPQFNDTPGEPFDLIDIDQDEAVVEMIALINTLRECGSFAQYRQIWARGL